MNSDAFGGPSNVGMEEIIDNNHEKKDNKNIQTDTTEVEGQNGGEHKVLVEDLTISEGPEATYGQKVTISYSSSLETSEGPVECKMRGDEIEFTLGEGKVIRGWDEGICGMRVGSTRKIKCPPAMAYGRKGIPFIIPQNATIIFEITLHNIVDN